MNATGPFLGVDGGGSKTELVCMDADRTVRGRASVGSTYHPQIGVEGVAARLKEGLATLLSPLSLTPGALRFAFFGLPAFGEDSVADPLLIAACGRLLGSGATTTWCAGGPGRWGWRTASTSWRGRDRSPMASMTG